MFGSGVYHNGSSFAYINKLTVHDVFDSGVLSFHFLSSARVKISSTKLDDACDVISMFKLNYIIAFHGISINQFYLVLIYLCSAGIQK